ncbi:hypothetical protein NESM_000383300 [Novymonas esmeraldas]|uniref:Uncharacterized protein n=1 Tax=Novymonas esmeraldas TaxID=1808958 RepID=A0AAW0EMS4_9TRYP
MEALHLPFTPGSATDVLHPFHVAHLSYSLLRHALSAFHPDTAVVRRIHHRPRSSHGVETERRVGVESLAGDDGVSVTSSRQSRRSSAAMDAAGDRPHRRRRSSSGDSAATPSGQRHRRRSSLESGASGREAREAADATTTSGRRTRSAEEPLAVSRRASIDGAGSSSTSVPGSSGGRVRRSHSDGVRGRTRSLPGGGGGGGDGNVAGTGTNARSASSVSHPLSPAATAAAASGMTPPLAPPPPVTDIGKPPLGSRRPSSSRTPAGTPDLATRSRHRHHRSGSEGLSSSSRRSSRSRRSERGGDDNDDDDGAGSVVVIDDGEAARLTASVSAWSPARLWNRVRTRQVTRAAYLIDHVLHAVPVVVVHYCCELKRQLATLPLLRFADSLTPTSTTAAAAAAAWLPTEETLEAAPTPRLAHFLLTRWVLATVESYVAKVFFLDESLVVRQLRSRRLRRRLLGWGLRLVSRTLFDPILLSVVVPILLSWSIAPDAGDATRPPRVLLTVPGAVRGLAVSAAGVAVQWLVMPLASHLVDRAVLTVFEAVEYLIMRRYARWSDDEDEDEDEDELDEAEDGGAGGGGGDDDRMSLVSGISDGMRSQQSVSAALSRDATPAEKRVQREQRQLRRERRERQRRRERRQAEREHAMRAAVLRAIVYRVVASLVAQSLIDHPLSVLVELLRGRATLHFTGLLQPYAAMTADKDGLSWVNLWRYASRLPHPTAAVPSSEDGDGDVPPLVTALRRAGRAMTQELVVLTSSVVAVSGQTEAITDVRRRAAQAVARGDTPSAADSAEFMAHSLSSLSPFYHGLQFTVIDKLLSFYMAVWTRLSKQ